MLAEFKAFALKGNVVDLAVGVIIGGAFGGIVKSLVDDVIMPPIGLVLGQVDFSNLFLVLKPGKAAAVTLAQAKAAGAVTLNYGQFINSGVNFLIVAWAVFFLVRALTRLQMKDALAPVVAPPAPTKDCKFCLSKINPAASRCPNCTSEVPVVTDTVVA